MNRMRPVRRSKFFFGYFLALSLLLSLVLSACGGDNTPASNSPTAALTQSTAQPKQTNQPGTAPATTSAAVATKTPVTVAPTPTAPANLKAADQTLTIVSSDVESLDPALANDVGSTFVLNQIYSGLVTLDKDLKVVPDLARTLPDVSADGTVYTFNLRPGIKFHSGKELTTEDIKYSWERATDLKLAAPATIDRLTAATYMTDIMGAKDKLDGKAQTLSGVTVKDKYTLQVKIDSPKPYFLAKMTYNCFFAVNSQNIASIAEKPDGSGPFKLVEYNKDQSIKLARNADFYNGPPRLQTVTILQGAASANSLTLYEQGRIDYVFANGNAVERAMDKTNPLNKELLVKPRLDLSYLAFNNRQKPFDDPKIRQAFSMVIDRDRIVRAMFENKVVKATTILPPGMPGYTGNAGPISYDVNKARDLIAQSSYRSAQNLPKITLYTTGSGLAKVLQDVYKQSFGIDLEVRQPDFNDFQSGLSAFQYQMYLNGWVADYPDPENFLRTLLGAGSPTNQVGYNNPKFNDLMKQGDEQADPAKRLDLYAKAEQIALEDVPIFPIYHSISYLLVKPYVKGLDLTPASIISLKDIYIVNRS